MSQHPLPPFSTPADRVSSGKSRRKEAAEVEQHSQPKPAAEVEYHTRRHPADTRRDPSDTRRDPADTRRHPADTGHDPRDYRPLSSNLTLSPRPDERWAVSAQRDTDRDTDRYTDTRYGRRSEERTQQRVSGGSSSAAGVIVYDAPEGMMVHETRIGSTTIPVSFVSSGEMQSSPIVHPLLAASTAGGAASRGSETSGRKLRVDHYEIAKERKYMESMIVDDVSVKFEDMVGVDDAIETLRMAVEGPLLYPELFVGSRLLKPDRGILLFGPPGTGKTMLASAVAAQCKCTFFNVTAAHILSSFPGVAEQRVQALFDVARARAPSVIFIDEVEGMLRSRSQATGDPWSEQSTNVCNLFLQNMSGIVSHQKSAGGAHADGDADSQVQKQVVVIAATNYPELIDSAALSRFSKRILVMLPVAEAIHRHMVHYVEAGDIAFAHDVDLAARARVMESKNLSMREIGTILSELALLPRKEAMRLPSTWRKGTPEQMRAEMLRISRRPLTNRDFDSAMSRVKSSTPMEQIHDVIEWASKHASH